LGVAIQLVAARLAAVACEQFRLDECPQDALEVLDGEVLPFGDILQLGKVVWAVLDKVNHNAQGISTFLSIFS
jgi:hypothetical protein